MKTRKPLHVDAPLIHPDHPRPKSRRDFLRYGFTTGIGTVVAPTIFGLFANPDKAHAALSSDIASLVQECGIDQQGAGKIPFICFDLAGGANFAGSNVLAGGPGGQLDLLSTQGYSRLGLPGDMVPVNATQDFIDTRLGLAFHSDSAILRGIFTSMNPANATNVDGVVIPARSDNDTGNNPHNPLYAINKLGADGSLLTLIGSRSSDSGGNSMSPSNFMDLEKRPTKVDRPSDVTGLVDTGELISLLNQADAVAVMETIARISRKKMSKVTTEEVVRDLVNCGYIKSADLANRFGNPAELDPSSDPEIATIFGADYDTDGELRKTASVMKLVVNGYAGAGCISMGGFDYHTGDRATGEMRDFRAGRCIGACLEYAANRGKPIMIYVFSDGSVASNGVVDNSTGGRGKGQWTGDNSSTACAFFLVYNPTAKPQLVASQFNADDSARRQIGYFRPDASVDTGSSAAANNVNLLVETISLNYLALHGGTYTGSGNAFDTLLPMATMPSALRESMVAFEPMDLSSLSNS